MRNSHRLAAFGLTAATSLVGQAFGAPTLEKNPVAKAPVAPPLTFVLQTPNGCGFETFVSVANDSGFDGRAIEAHLTSRNFASIGQEASKTGYALLITQIGPEKVFPAMPTSFLVDLTSTLEPPSPMVPSPGAISLFSLSAIVLCQRGRKHQQPACPGIEREIA